MLNLRILQVGPV